MLAMEVDGCYGKSMAALILTGCHGSQGLLRNFSCWFGSHCLPIEVNGCLGKSLVVMES
jgi:hypothetical protein